MLGSRVARLFDLSEASLELLLCSCDVTTAGTLQEISIWTGKNIVELKDFSFFLLFILTSSGPLNFLNITNKLAFL